MEKQEKFSLFSEFDVYLFKEGTHYALYEKMGAHSLSVEGVEGTYFALWAPSARHVSVIGDFNEWNPSLHFLNQRADGSGIWEGFIPRTQLGDRYKFHVETFFGEFFDKGDPFAFLWEEPPKTASVITTLDYLWGDNEWLDKRKNIDWAQYPLTFYEVHLGSWMRSSDERWLNYKEIASHLVAYVKEMGFSAVEIMPVMEHPFYGSWGYQVTGFFAPTRRYGIPQDFMFLIDALHQAGIAVFLDWVPSHFPSDSHGLASFDGTALYEHLDMKQRIHPEWKSYLFNYGRTEVAEILINSALFWLDYYHADGLRVDGVASMLYLDYGRKDGEWVPNKYGGRENLQAVSFLQKLNQAIFYRFPSVQTIAEESTAWPLVTKPPYDGGLGFSLKWNMGWMHDILDYMSLDPFYRQFHQNDLTFSFMYAFSENFVLPFSHDEVVYGKRSLLWKMPGDLNQKFAQLRLLFGYMYAHPGKKLIFMGGEFGQCREWDHQRAVDWWLLGEKVHKNLQRWVQDLNRFYTEEQALHGWDFIRGGFEWIGCSDNSVSVLGFLRRVKGIPPILALFNFTPVPRFQYDVGVSEGGYWLELLNSDGEVYGGDGMGNLGGQRALDRPRNSMRYSLSLTLPPFGALFFRKEGE